MVSMFEVSAAAIRSSWEFPLSPEKTVRRFADNAEAVSIAIGVSIMLALVSTAAEPVSIKESWNESPQVDYSLPNLIAVYLENVVLSLAALGFAIVVSRLLGARFPAGRLAFARLVCEGFAVVWFAIFAVAGRLFPSFAETSVSLVLLVLLLGFVVYGLWLSYGIGAGLPSSKAAVATGLEFSVLVFVVGAGYAMGEAS